MTLLRELPLIELLALYHEGIFERSLDFGHTFKLIDDQKFERLKQELDARLKRIDFVKPTHSI